MHFDNWLFVLLIAMAALLRLLATKVGNGKNKPEEPEQKSQVAPPPLPRATANSEEERIRKFLEALGVPTTSEPPPKIEPRRTPVPLSETNREVVAQPQRPFPKRSILNPLPPLTTVPPPQERPRRVILPRVITEPPYEEKPFTPRVMEPAVFEVQESAPPTPEPPLVITAPAAAYTSITEQKREPETKETSIAVLLRSPSGLRQAIILREILGPPRSLQPLELIGTAL